MYFNKQIPRLQALGRRSTDQGTVDVRGAMRRVAIECATKRSMGRTVDAEVSDVRVDPNRPLLHVTMGASAILTEAYRSSFSSELV